MKPRQVAEYGAFESQQKRNFEIYAIPGELKPDGDEVIESGWFDREHLP